MKNFGEIVSDQIIEKTKTALEKNGIKVLIAQNGQEAKEIALGMLHEGAEIMTMTSVTTDSIGLSKEINESKKYNSVRDEFSRMDKVKQGLEMQKLGAGPEFAIGSVHAVTEDGKVVVASATGSQLPAYAFGASHVIWIVGAQKIVKDLDEGMKRIYEYVLPLESERAMKAYGVTSSVNKILIFNKEVNPTRLSMVIVKEKLGF